MIQRNGFSLIELAIAIALSSIVAAGTLSVFFSQSKAINNDEHRTQNEILSESIYNDLSRLMRHAILDTLDIQYGSGQLNTDEPEIADDMITIDFAIPADYPIWPNDQSPFDKNWIRLQWSNMASSNQPYGIMIGTAKDKALLSTALLSALDSGENNYVIANLDFWPLSAGGQPLGSPQATPEGGYLLQVSARSKGSDPSYQNPKLPVNSPLTHNRTHIVSGLVAPRN
jgi:prepilin-type N-terminal cleavage/methylation domain-containing protein